MVERVGPYAVVRELGAGGMGTVYLARSRGGRLLAVKAARPELAADPEFRARFRAEVARQCSLVLEMRGGEPPYDCTLAAPDHAAYADGLRRLPEVVDHYCD